MKRPDAWRKIATEHGWTEADWIFGRPDDPRDVQFFKHENGTWFRIWIYYGPDAEIVIRTGTNAPELNVSATRAVAFLKGELS